MQKDVKELNLNVKKDDKPSRFLVDLNPQIEDEVPVQKNIFGVFNFNKKEPKKIIRYRPIESTKYINSKKISSAEILPKTISDKRINQILFVSIVVGFYTLLMRTLKLFGKFFHEIGWIVLFSLRFVFFFFKKIFEISIPLLISLSNIIKRILYAERKKNNVYEEDDIEDNIFEKEINYNNRTAFRNNELIVQQETETNCDVENGIESESSFEGHDKEEQKNKFKLIFPKIHFSFKPVIVFAIVMMILILPFKAVTFYKQMIVMKGKVMGVSESAISEMKKASVAASQFDFENAEINFTQASNNFSIAKKEIENVNGLIQILSAVVPNKDLRMASNANLILEAGILSAEIGNNITEIFSSLPEEKIGLKEAIDIFDIKSNDAFEKIIKLNGIIFKINPDYLPEEHVEKFLLLKEKSALVEKSLKQLIEIVEDIKAFTGSNGMKRYLLVFQNNTEMRASGGFIGSFALLDFRNGELVNIEIPEGGSYDMEAGYYERVVSPEPLHLVNPLWHFWDANWWPDWPMTAKKLMWFYENSDGPTVDGVISLTPKVMEDILKIIGPVDMRVKYGIYINSDNFLLNVQRLAEQKTEDNKPKKIIGDLFRKITDDLPSMLNKNMMVDFAKVLDNNLLEKHVLFYFNDKSLQQRIESFGWNGGVKNTEGDYLMVVNTNIAGGKSDKNIVENINYTSQIMPDGSVINTVEIERTHTAIKNEEFYGVRNVDWMRIYVPKGSELIEARGFNAPDRKYFESPDQSWSHDEDVINGEGQARMDIKSGTKIYEELDKTVFANWSQVDPGRTVKLFLRYKIPVRILENPGNNLKERIENLINPNLGGYSQHTLLFQKQPGSVGSTLNAKMISASENKFIWSDQGEINNAENTFGFSTILTADRSIGILFEHKN